MTQETALVPSAPAAKAVVKIPPLRFGDQDKVAANFKKLFRSAEDAKFRITAFGIYAWHVRVNLLKHGQFGPWVEATIGEKSYRTVRDHMNFAESSLQKCGVKSIKDQMAKWQNLPICHSGKFLLLPDSKVPEATKPLRAKLLDLYKNKTKNQLYIEWKQAEEETADVQPPPKRGRLKGQGGASAEQRAAAEAAAEQDRRDALLQRARSLRDELLQFADLKILGELPDPEFQSLGEALQTLAAPYKEIKAARKGVAAK